MKQIRKQLPALTAVAVLGILLCLNATGVHGAQGSEVLPSPIDPLTGAVFPVDPVLFDPTVAEHRTDVDFDAVPLSDIVKWLREVPAYHDVNFVVSPRLTDYGGPRVVRDRVDFGPNEPITVKLRSAGLRDILNAIGIATDNRVMFEVRTPTLVALVPGPGAGSSMASEPLQSLPPPTYQIINVREQLRLKEPEALDETIRTVRELVSQTLDSIHGNTNLAPKLQFHPGSGILVIVGQPEAIKVTMDVLRNLSIPREE
jgi:hypothetical protein